MGVSVMAVVADCDDIAQRAAYKAMPTPSLNLITSAVALPCASRVSVGRCRALAVLAPGLLQETSIPPGWRHSWACK